jgi:hypothetical protein
MASQEGGAAVEQAPAPAPAPAEAAAAPGAAAFDPSQRPPLPPAPAAAPQQQQGGGTPITLERASARRGRGGGPGSGSGGGRGVFAATGEAAAEALAEQRASAGTSSTGTGRGGRGGRGRGRGRGGRGGGAAGGPVASAAERTRRSELAVLTPAGQLLLGRFLAVLSGDAPAAPTLPAPAPADGAAAPPSGDRSGAEAATPAAADKPPTRPSSGGGGSAGGSSGKGTRRPSGGGGGAAAGCDGHIDPGAAAAAERLLTASAARLRASPGLTGVWALGVRFGPLQRMLLQRGVDNVKQARGWEGQAGAVGGGGAQGAPVLRSGTVQGRTHPAAHGLFPCVAQRRSSPTCAASALPRSTRSTLPRRR